MIVAAFGYLPPVTGALLQEVIDVAVLNALRVLTGKSAPAPLTDRRAVDRVVEEHAQLRALLDRMRRAADRIDQRGDNPIVELRTINAELNALLLPHQLAEERAVFPELAHRLGGRDPLSSMTRMHEEIAHLATRFTALVQGLLDAILQRRRARGETSALFARCDHLASSSDGRGASVAGRGSAGPDGLTVHDCCPP